MAGQTYEVQVNQGITFQHTGVFDVTFYGAKSDGSADSSGGEQAAVDACEAAGGGTVYYPPGTYTRVSTHVTVPAAVEIRFLGDAVWIDGDNSADHAFVFDVGNGAGDYPTFPLVCFEGLGFKNFLNRGIEQSSYETGGITRLEVVRCKFDNVALGLHFYSRIGSALIWANTFKDASSSEVACLFIGSKYESDVEYCGNYLIKENFATNMQSTHATESSNLFQAFGRDVIYTNNIIEDNDAPNATNKSAGMIVLGVKAYNVSINGNILNNAGGSEDGHIYVKGIARGGVGDSPFTNGGPSYAVVISDNVVISTRTDTDNASESGISVDMGTFGSDNMHIHENYVEGMNTYGIKIEGSGEHNDMSIQGNTVYNTVGDYPIRLYTTGSRLTINGNKISGVGNSGTNNPTGIRVEGVEDLTDVVVKDNIITDNGVATGTGTTFGIYLTQRVGDMLRPIVKNNIITLTAAAATQEGITCSIADTATITNCIIRDNEVDITDTLGKEYNVGTTQMVIYVDKDISTPEGNVAGRIGDVFYRLDGSTSTTLYVKTSGDWTTTTWTAK